MIEHYQAGVNLGGWISQYRTFDHRHFESFITAADIEQIATWGMDHVRLPVDYPVLESDDAPGDYLERGFGYVDSCLEWCQQRGLGVVLDLHHAPGYSFNFTLEDETKEQVTLFDDEGLQMRFIALWEFITRRYLGQYQRCVFELMNEVQLPSTDPWNRLAARAIKHIRAIDPSRAILIGGNYYNAVSELENLAVVDDPLVDYTFHFYEPILFTHQFAGWVEAARQFNQALDYPGPIPGLKAFLEQHPKHERLHGHLIDRTMDRDLLVAYLTPAKTWMEQTGRPLYCGEFGVIDAAPMASSVRWHADLIDILQEWGIGGAVWSYKLMDFGLVDADGAVINPDLVKIVSR